MPSISQKHRPKVFADITGQRAITETLRKEVATGVLGHAYLFSGPRGVGKTTAARVFAKALNCQSPTDGEPCNACAACSAANAGRWLDIVEMDAATHTQVEKVREAIIEHVRFAPAMGKRKVYILDEVHMFSTASWNALLKTLEEPPAYAFFILATTEWHKVPATIVSRCQRFEFKRISETDLAQRLRVVAREEGWTVEDEVIKLIVARADGCVRDAETLLSQLGSLGRTKIDRATADLVIPPSQLPLAAGLFELWAQHDHAGALAEARRLFDEGVPLLPLFDDLIELVRRMLIASGEATLKDRWLQGTEEERCVVPLIGAFTPAELNDLALLLFERRRDVKAGIDPLFALQLAGTFVANGLLRHSSKERGAEADKKSGDRGQVVADQKPALKIEPPSPQKPEAPSTPSEPEITPSTINESHASTLELSSVRVKWPAIIRAVDEQNHSLPFILKISQPEAVDGNTVVIRFQYAFHRDKILSDLKHRRIVENCAREILQMPALQLDGVVGEDLARQETRTQDMVTNVLKAFGGQIVESS